MNTVDDIELPALRAGTSQPEDLFNASDYRGDLEGLDISDEQAQEFLGVLWSIMTAMVDLGFSGDLCGQIFDSCEIVPASPVIELESTSAKRGDA